MRSGRTRLGRPRGAGRRAALVAGAGLATSMALGLVACGSDSKEPAAVRGEPVLPFPPVANEPATSKGGGPTPAGRVIPIGGRPEGLAVDPASGALGISLDDQSHRFAILDATTLKVRRTVPLLGEARHVTAWGGDFLVPMEKVDRLAQVPAAGGEPTITKVGDEPHFALGVGNQILVGDEYGGTITVLKGGKVRAQVPVDVQPGGIADVGGGQVALVSVRAYTIELMNTTTFARGGSQNAGYGPSHAVATPDGRALVADTRGGAILVYSTRPRLKFIQRLKLGGSPYGIAVDNQRRRLWVTDSGADTVTEISTAGTLEVVGSKPTVRQPNTVAVDPRTGAIYIASEATGQLEMIKP